MDAIIPPPFIGANFFFLVSKDIASILTPKQPMGLGVPLPDHIICGLGRQPVPVFITPQPLLRLFPFRDITADPYQPNHFSIVVAERDFAG